MSLLSSHEHEWIASGWLRWLPVEALALYSIVADLEGQGWTRDFDDLPPDSEAAVLLDRMGGLDAPLTDDRRGVRRAMRRACRVYGLDRVGNLGELLNLMIQMELVHPPSHGVGAWHAQLPLPLPGERVRLTRKEGRREDLIRWKDLHEDIAQNIIRIFVDHTLDVWRGSLQRLGHQLDEEPENIREAVLLLVEEGDFTATADVARIGVSKDFELRVDWKKFNRQRISIKFG